MSVVSGILSIKDNVTTVLRGVRNEQSAFRQDVAATRNELRQTYDQRRTARIETTAASRGMQQLRERMEPLRKKIVMATALKDAAMSKLKTVANKVKAVGKMVAKPLIAIKDATAAGLSKIGGALKSVAKGVAIPVSIAGGALLAGAISQGAKLEQSIGGVETLFKDDAGVVKANADKAFATAGLSANEYMEQVTSFSASLLNSLGGDTGKAASVADMAMIDMADNANKFGTDMDSIQNAYQGFAKQNYTMLDNLKLGYGGTKEEMNRLLKDATKLTGVKYNIDNLSDVYSAIHAVQENLGVTGTTAKEASETFSGSFAAMKASVSNLLGNLATGGDVESSVKQLVDSAGTFLFKNAIPMVGRIIKALPGAIKQGLATAGPVIQEAGADILKGLWEGLASFAPPPVMGILGKLVDGFKTLIPTFQEFGDSIMSTLGTVFSAALPLVESAIGTLQQTLPSILPVISTVLSTIGDLFAQAAPVIGFLVSAIGTAVQALAPVFQTIFGQIGQKVGSVVSFIASKMGFLQGIIDWAMPLVADIFSTAWSIIGPILDVAISVFKYLFNIVQAVFPAIKAIIGGVWDFLKPIFEGIGTAVGWIADGIGWLADSVGGWLGGGEEAAAPEVEPASTAVAVETAPASEAVIPEIAPAVTGDGTTVEVENGEFNFEGMPDMGDFDIPDPSGGGYTMPAPADYAGAQAGGAAAQPVEQHIDQSVTVTIAQLADVIKEEADAEAIAALITDRIVAAVQNAQAAPATT